jgi:flagellar motor switch protein FliG
MFTFGDLARIGGQDIARVMRGMTGNTVPLALKGSGEEMRQHFLNALPGRSRDMLTEEIEALGPVRARDVRDAQNAMVDYAMELIRAEVIQLPMRMRTRKNSSIDESARPALSRRVASASLKLP